MGYMHIPNLYKDTRIMNFKECYAMEKVHGTSARVQWKDNKIMYHSGGTKYETFIKINDFQHLENRLLEEFKDVDVIVYGESYGGKEQGMSETYGKEPMFIVFEVQIDGTWLNVPNAEEVANKLNLEFVPYVKCSTDLESLNYQRDLPSVVAQRRGIKEAKLREGIVCKPLKEFVDKRGNRVIVKHKRDEFMETKTPRKVDPEKLKVLKEAQAIADEWVTPMRFNHVLDKFEDKVIENTGKFCKAMVEDVFREAEGEIEKSKEAFAAISKAASKMYVKYVKTRLI